MRDSFLVKNAPWLASGAILTLLSSFGQTFFISIFAAEIQTEFALSHGSWGGIYALGTTTSAVVMVWAGGLTDKFRVRTLGPLVLLLLAFACLLMAFNPYAWFLPVVIFALRLSGQGMTTHIAVVAMARWFVAARGRALSIAALGYSVGQALLPILFVMLLELMDWRILWVFAALISLAGVPILIRLLKKERTPQSMANENPSFGMNARFWNRFDAIKHPLFWCMVPSILGPSAFNTAFFFHQVHFAELKDISHVTLVAQFPLYTAVSVAAMLFSGWGLDKIGTSRLIPFFQVPMIAAFIVFGMSDGIYTVMLGFVLLGLTAGATATLPSAFWAEFYGTKHIGSIKALAAAVMVLGSAIGPGVTGFLIDYQIGLEVQFYWIAVYFALATLVLWVGVRRYAPSLKA
ncbi:MAG: MFS family permease [Candidatus Azotimanducaceae bacterium]|jgi:MFS family permease